MKRYEQEYCLIYPRKVEYVSVLREDLQKIFPSGILSVKTVNDTCFIINEVFTNFVRHSQCSIDSEIRISLKYSPEDKFLSISLDYPDSDSKPLNVVKPDVSEYPSGGFGLFMSCAMSSESFMEYDNQSGRRLFFFKIRI